MRTRTPTVGAIVHYVSHGTPPRADGSQAFTSQCRAAIVTGRCGEANEHGDCLSLSVLNPTGMFFLEHVCQHDGGETPGDPDCAQPGNHGPFRYCPCGWAEAGHKGGTWHWPEGT